MVPLFFAFPHPYPAFERDQIQCHKRISLGGQNMADDDSGETAPPLEQAEFDINDANTDAAHRAICDAVNGLNGVREVQFVGGGVVVTFNPIGITKEEICTAIRRSGYRATEITTSSGDAGKVGSRRSAV